MRATTIAILLYTILIISCDDQSASTPSTAVSASYDMSHPDYLTTQRLVASESMDSLHLLAEDDEPAVRLMIARALASLQDDQSITVLTTMLQDDYDDVKQAAAYALGQSGRASVVQSLLQAYDASDSLRLHSQVNGTVLEAIGKTGDASMLAYMPRIAGISPRDTQILLGQTRAIYRFALRSLVDSSATAYMAKLTTADGYPIAARSIAAQYLARTASIDITPYSTDLQSTLSSQSDARLRMAIASALSKDMSPASTESLGKAAADDTDYRVRLSAIRSLGAHGIAKSREMIQAALQDDHPMVRMTAISQLLNQGTAADARLLYAHYSSAQDPQEKYAAASAANKLLSWRQALTRDNLNAQLKADYSTSQDPYTQAAILQAMSHDVQNQGFIERIASTSKNPVLLMGSLSALKTLYTSDKFRKYYGGQYQGNLRKAGTRLMQFMDSGDSGSIAFIASILSDERMGLTAKNISVDKLKQIRSDLTMPRDMDAYQELGKLIAQLEGTDYELAAPAQSYKPDWSLLTSETPVATIRTTRGTIQIDLDPLAAPVSVINFIQLSEAGYYNGKSIHRVVPNFVIQGGCPRGDGMGSADYTMHSEVPQGYYDKAGKLGMASAGPHTESVQWFITHSPTPHLDGKYTIMGQVSSGMDIVHDTRIGDKIQDITIIR